MITFKDNVDITGINKIMRCAIRRTHEIFQKYDSNMIITSAKRSPLMNKIVQGAEKSKHLEGKAIDLRTRHLPDPKLIYQEIKSEIERFGYQVILEKDHIHIESED